MSVLAMFGSSEIGDPEGTRTVYAIIALLIVIGLGLIMLAFWLRRATRPDPELLGPLELMGERSWREGDPASQQRRLDEVRPPDANPLEHPTVPPAIDTSTAAAPAGADRVRIVDETAGTEPAPEAGPGAVAACDTTIDEPQVEVEVEDQGAVEATADGGESAEKDGPDTPPGLERPDDDVFDDVFEHEIDPEVLERASAELDAELRRRGDGA